MARLFLQVILLVAFVAVLDCAPTSPPLTDPVPTGTHDTPQSKAHDAIATPPKPRTARAAQQSPPAPVNPLQSVPEARANEQTTTVRARPARAADHEGKPHEDNPVLHGTQLDGNERSHEGHSTTPKSRPARAADHEGKPHDEINPLAASSQSGKDLGDHDEHSHTTPKTRPVRAADHDGKPHDDHEGHSTTPKPRPVRAADHDGKPHDDHEGHSTTPKPRPVRAADHDGKPHDDHEGHSTTPKPRPARASGVPGKPDDEQVHPAPAVPLAKLGNTEQNTTPKSRPARAADAVETVSDATTDLHDKAKEAANTTPKSRPARAADAVETVSDATTDLHDKAKEAADKKEDEKVKEHRHTRDTEGPQDISKTLTHVLVRGEPVPINLDEKAEDKIKENLPDRKRRDTETKKDESVGKAGTGQAGPLLAAQVQPAIQPLPAHHDRQRRDDAKAAARQPDAPLKTSQPDSHSGHSVPLIGLANPENSARHTRDTGSSTLPPFKGIHGPTQGDLENIRRAKEEREKHDH